MLSFPFQHLFAVLFCTRVVFFLLQINEYIIVVFFKNMGLKGKGIMSIKIKTEI